MPKMTTTRHWYYPLPNPYYCPYENVTDGDGGQAASSTSTSTCDCDSGIDISKTSGSGETLSDGDLVLDFERHQAQDESGRANLDDSGRFEEIQSESNSSNERFPAFSFRKNDTGSWMVCDGGMDQSPAGGTWIISSDMDLIGGPLPSLPSLTSRPPAALDFENSSDEGQRERCSLSEAEFEDRYSSDDAEHFGSDKDVSEPPETQDDFNPDMNSTLELNISDISVDYCHELASANQEDLLHIRSSQAQDDMTAQENSAHEKMINDCQTTETSGVSVPAPFMLSEMVEQLSRILELANIRRQNDGEERRAEKNYSSDANVTHNLGLQQQETFNHNPHITQVKYSSSRVLFPNRILDSSHPTTSYIFANRLSQCRQCHPDERMSLSLTTQTEIPVQGTHEKVARSDH